MLQRSPKQLALIALAIMLAAFFITYLSDFGFAVAVMMLIAAAGFLTIVAVMIIGSTHGESPVSASDSNAVAAWNERVNQRKQSEAPAEEETASEAADEE